MRAVHQRFPSERITRFATISKISRISTTNPKTSVATRVPYSAHEKARAKLATPPATPPGQNNVYTWLKWKWAGGEMNASKEGENCGSMRTHNM